MLRLRVFNVLGEITCHVYMYFSLVEKFLSRESPLMMYWVGTMHGKMLIKLKVKKDFSCFLGMSWVLTRLSFSVRCPFCDNKKAYFMQIQIRSADMTEVTVYIF